MSYQINLNQTSLKEMAISANKCTIFPKKTDWKLSGVESEQCDSSTDTILNISGEGKERLLNSENKTTKKAGVTSAREQFETIALNDRNNVRGKKGLHWVGHEAVEEWMKLDDPEAYAEYKRLFTPANPDEQELEGLGKFVEWYRKNCFNDKGEPINPVTGSTILIQALEARYSDVIHDVSFNICHESLSEKDNSLWRFGTKFNVLLSADMLQEMELIRNFDSLSKAQQESVKSKFGKMDSAINAMKQIEKDYEGNHVYLRFGVKFDEDYNATYHANYAGCENADGIMGYTPQELLQQLMAENMF